MNKHCDNCRFNDNGFCNVHIRFTAWMFSNYCNHWEEKKEGEPDERNKEQRNAAM